MFRSALAILLLLVAACSSEPDDQMKREESPATAEISTETKAAEEAEAATAEPVQEDVVSQDIAGGTPKFAPQEGWTTEKPSSNMRTVQYRLPASKSDQPDAEVVVFFFDGGGGDVESNFLRWEGQFRAADGSPVMGLASDFMVKGRRIDVIELEGKYSGMSGGGGEGMAMIGAIVESEYGPYFVRLLGQQAAVEAWRDSFMAFLKALY